MKPSYKNTQDKLSWHLPGIQGSLLETEMGDYNKKNRQQN